MNRAPSLLLALLLAVTGLGIVGAVSAVPSQAAETAPVQRGNGPLTGRIVAAESGAGVKGMTVRLRKLADGGGPGAVVDTATTAADGSFALDAGANPQDEYYVQGMPGRYQGGYVGGSPKFLQPDVDDSGTWGAHAALGKIGANPAFIRGVLVDADTRRPVRGLTVTGGTYGEGPVDEDVTDRAGRFVIRGITCEDSCFLRFKGRPRGYETGYWGCLGNVVPTWGDACAATLADVGKVRIERR